LNNDRLVLQEASAVMAALDEYPRRPTVGFEFARKAGNLPLGTFDRALGTLEGAQNL